MQVEVMTMIQDVEVADASLANPSLRWEMDKLSKSNFLRKESKLRLHQAGQHSGALLSLTLLMECQKYAHLRMDSRSHLVTQLWITAIGFYQEKLLCHKSRDVTQSIILSSIDSISLLSIRSLWFLWVTIIKMESLSTTIMDLNKWLKTYLNREDGLKDSLNLMLAALLNKEEPTFKWPQLYH